MKEEHKLKSHRRDFLGKVIFGWFFVTLLPAIYGIVEYIIPPKARERTKEHLRIAKFSDIPINSSKIVKFNEKPIILINFDGQVKAHSAVCTHLGCIVQYVPDNKQFICNCHGSIFDASGINVSGPASRPLQPFRVTLQQDDIIVSEL